MNEKISVVDDDPAVLDALHLLLAARGYETECFSSAPAFLDAAAQSSCIISDVRMPQMSGLEVLAALKKKGDVRPVILLTGHGDIQMAVQAIKQGAYEFIEKPFEAERLLSLVGLAVEKRHSELRDQAALKEAEARYSGLSERQKETMSLIVAGLANKEIAVKLGISPRTVEIHRTWVMNKMAARTVADLVRMGVQLRLV